jgi:hypothetical protein
METTSAREAMEVPYSRLLLPKVAETAVRVDHEIP